MDISLMITVPKRIYDIYAYIADKAEGCTVDTIMAQALMVYATRTFPDILKKEQSVE